MRKVCMLILGVVICSLFTVNISFGNDNCARRPSIAPDLVGTMEIMLHVVNVQRIGQWSKPVVEMLLSDSEKKKTGSDFKGRYKEIPFSKYEPGYDDNSNMFYYLVTTIESDDVYHPEASKVIERLIELNGVIEHELFHLMDAVDPGYFGVCNTDNDELDMDMEDIDFEENELTYGADNLELEVDVPDYDGEDLDDDPDLPF